MIWVLQNSNKLCPFFFLFVFTLSETWLETISINVQSGAILSSAQPYHVHYHQVTLHLGGVGSVCVFFFFYFFFFGGGGGGEHA